MKYLKLFNSHNNYTSVTISDKPAVAYDNEHVHYIKNDEEESTPTPEPEQTKYTLTVEVIDMDFGGTDSYDYSYAENEEVNTMIGHLSISDYNTLIYNADTNEEITSSSPITVTIGSQGTNYGFIIAGTMPSYNVKVSITVSSLA